MMKRSIILFLVGLFTVGLISYLGIGESAAQPPEVSAPAEVGSVVSSEMIDGWAELYPDAVREQASDPKARMDAGAARAAIAFERPSEAMPNHASVLGNLTPSGNTVIVYRWNAIPWKKLALRWIAVLGFTWLIGSAANHSKWSGGYWLGAVLGSVGFFLLSPLYINHIPHWPLAALGSSLPELGGVSSNTSALNPITASALIPFLMLAFLVSHPRFSWMTVGVSVGVAALLSHSFFVQPAVLWIGAGFLARLFLAVNALICLLIAYLSLKTITEPA